MAAATMAITTTSNDGGDGAARDDIGPDSAGELQRLQSEIKELHNRLKSKIEELRAAPPTTEALARTTGLQFLEIMPPAWRPELWARVGEHLSTAELVDELERRLQRAGINPAQQLQKIRARIEECRPAIDLKAMSAIGAA
jgi:hypothetical protein